MSPNCIQRSYSTVPTQALELTNSDVLRDRSRFLAGRLLDEYPTAPAKQIESLYLRTLSRPPSDREVKLAASDLRRLAAGWRTHLEKENQASPRQEAARWYALADLCHAILQLLSSLVRISISMPRGMPMTRRNFFNRFSDGLDGPRCCRCLGET